MTINLTAFSDRTAMVEAVSDRIHHALKSALNERTSALMALSGGSTPMPIYSRLAGMDLDWSRVIGLPSDERWVPTDHQASNYREILERFSGSDIRLESLVPAKADGQADPQHAIQVLAGLPATFDMVLLGMGGDGHFASLFPGSAALAAGLDTASHAQALAVVPDPLPPEAPYERVTLSLPRLLATRQLMLVITGQAKHEVLSQAARPDADPEQLPVAALLRAAGGRLITYWSP
ncbi:MAG: 6-phosphogluconolactonase [Wenzhouxiangella sp.]|nr:MAG: 6-phosphogluconolactonase [Wenzhouxiangella sp.]